MKFINSSRSLAFALSIALLSAAGCMAEEGLEDVTASDEVGAEAASLSKEGPPMMIVSRDSVLKDDGTVVERTVVREAKEDEVGIAQATTSFTIHCNSPEGAAWDGFPVISAYAAGCRRRDGSYSGRQNWTGRCFGDVSNCNGTIGCFSSCP